MITKFVVRRVVAITTVSWLVAYGLFELALRLSDRLAAKPDENGDLHGFVNPLFGALVGTLIGIPITYVQGIVLGTTNSKEQPSAPSVATTLPEQAQAATRYRLTLAATIVFLVLVWDGAALYSQLLYEAVKQTLTDPTIVGANASVTAAEKVRTTIRGVFYLGTYFPLLSVSAFLAGYFHGRPISWRVLLLPAAVTYGTLMLLAIQLKGSALGFPGVTIPTGEQNQEGEVALFWVKVIMLRASAVAFLASCGWVWTWLGYRLARWRHQDPT